MLKECWKEPKAWTRTCKSPQTWGKSTFNICGFVFLRPSRHSSGASMLGFVFLIPDRVALTASPVRSSSAACQSRYFIASEICSLANWFCTLGFLAGRSASQEEV